MVFLLLVKGYLMLSLSKWYFFLVFVSSKTSKEEGFDFSLMRLVVFQVLSSLTNDIYVGKIRIISLS